MHMTASKHSFLNGKLNTLALKTSLPFVFAISNKPELISVPICRKVDGLFKKRFFIYLITHPKLKNNQLNPAVRLPLVVSC